MRKLNGISLLVDFDETISEKGHFPIPGVPIKDSLEYLNKLYLEGYYLIIWTCRNSINQLLAEKWLLDHGYMFDKINEPRPDELLLFDGKGTRKIWSHCYIGDDSLSWKVNGMPSWKEIYDMVQQLVPKDCIPKPKENE